MPREAVDHANGKKENKFETIESSLLKYSVKRKQPLSSNNVLACWSMKSMLPDFRIFKS